MSLTKRRYLTITLLIPIFLGCNKEDALDNLPQFPENARLKQVTSLMPGSEEGNIIEVYEYDDEGRVVTITTPKPDGTGASDYKDFTYNDQGQVEKIEHHYFNINLNDYVNLQTSTFTWSASGLKTREEIEYPETGQSEVLEFVYDGERLTRTNRYGSNSELVSYSVNAYDTNGNLVKTSELSPTDELTWYKTFGYANGLLTKAVSFAGHSNERVREEKYVYDKNKNLVIMQSIVKAPWISSTSYELHYEYFNNGM